MVKQTTPPPDEAASSTEEGKKERRSRSRHAGSLADYQTRKGKRWKFQIYVLIDPEKPELGEKRLTRGGFTDLEEAQAELTEWPPTWSTKPQVRGHLTLVREGGLELTSTPLRQEPERNFLLHKINDLLKVSC